MGRGSSPLHRLHLRGKKDHVELNHPPPPIAPHARADTAQVQTHGAQENAWAPQHTCGRASAQEDSGNCHRFPARVAQLPPHPPPVPQLRHPSCILFTGRSASPCVESLGIMSLQIATLAGHQAGLAALGLALGGGAEMGSHCQGKVIPYGRLFHFKPMLPICFYPRL